jgi:hydroxyacylglutathione hydrolase
MPTHRASNSIQSLGGGIYLIDAMYIRSGLVAIYLVVQDGRAAFIETGTTRSMPFVMAALEELGLAPEAVDYVIPTHVHLDHAGGAGAMVAGFPNARLVVHPRGARHMVDPARLWEGTVGVYGEAEARHLYGDIVPVAEDRIIEATDGLELDLAGRRFTCLDTPGHARHHCCIVDHHTNGIFTGDMFGLSYRELDIDGRPSALITTTPTQFDPDAMHASLARLLALEPDSVYLTHFSKVGDVDRLGDMLYRQLDEHVRIAERYAAHPAEERLTAITNELATYFRAEGRRLGWPVSPSEFDRIVMPDVRLNAKGLVAWLEQRSRPRRPAA